MSFRVAPFLSRVAERPATQSRVTHTGDPLADIQPEFWKKKAPTKDSGKIGRANKRGVVATMDGKKTRDEGEALSRGGNDITKTALGLSRRSNLNGPFDTRQAGRWSLIESIESN